MPKAVEAVPAEHKTLIAFLKNGYYIGLLCEAKNIDVQNGRIQLKSEIAVLPVYEFPEQESIKLNGMYFLSHIDLGAPISFLRMKDPLEVVKNSVLLRSPIAKLKSWITIREAREMRTFL